MMNSRCPRRVILAIVFALIGFGVAADVIRVPQDFPLIQQAIDAAQDGDEIIVSPDTYIEHLIIAKEIIMRSLDPSDITIVDRTIVFGDRVGQVATISRGEIRGLTIAGGQAGVRATGSAMVSLCRIVSNVGEGPGAGVFAGGFARIMNNRIAGNTSTAKFGRGGGVFAEGDAIVVDNQISANRATGELAGGGGISARERAQVLRNIVRRNSARLWGGGIYSDDATLVADNLVEENDAANGGGMTVARGAIVERNHIRLNTGSSSAGLRLNAGTARNNIIELNDGVGVSGTGRLEDNTIRDNTGLGVRIWSNSIIQRNQIIGNGAGGVECRDATLVQNNTIADNTGSGVRASDDALVRLNVIERNSGDGVEAVHQSEIVGNVISENGGRGALVYDEAIVRSNFIIANSGLGASVNGGHQSGPSFEANTVTQNVGGVRADLLFSLDGNLIAFSSGGFDLDIRSSVDESTVDYNCVFNPDGNQFGGDAARMMQEGTGNLTVDPLFLSDMIHLSFVSPCINAGDPNFVPLPGETDFDGEPRIARNRVDIGGDEVALPDIETNLINFQIITGMHIEGGVPELLASDDQYLRTRSGFGLQLSEAHLMNLLLSVRTNFPTAQIIEITIEARLDDPRGIAKLALRNWRTGVFDPVGQYSIGLNENRVTFENINATDHIRTSGAIEISIKHIVFVPFLAFRFESFLDLVQIQVE